MAGFFTTVMEVGYFRTSSLRHKDFSMEKDKNVRYRLSITYFNVNLTIVSNLRLFIQSKQGGYWLL